MLADILPLEQDAETVANEYEETFGISFVTVLPVRANLDAQLAWLSQPSQGGSGSSCAPGSQERLAVMEQHKRYLIAFITAVQSWLALGRPAPLPSPPAAPAGVPAANAAAADVGGGGSSGGGAQLVSSSAGTQQASTSGAQHVPGTSGTPTGLVSSTSGGGGGGGGGEGSGSMQAAGGPAQSVEPDGASRALSRPAAPPAARGRGPLDLLFSCFKRR